MHHHHRSGQSCGFPGMGSFMGSPFGLGQSTARGFLRPTLLLLLAEQPRHGYELMGMMTDFGMGKSGADPSIVYRLLKHLEAEGLATSSLNDSGSGPARKVYTLTPEGREVLDLWAANIESLTTFLAEFKERYEKLSAA